jgi:hypothetical protein
VRVRVCVCVCVFVFVRQKERGADIYQYVSFVSGYKNGFVGEQIWNGCLNLERMFIRAVRE